MRLINKFDQKLLNVLILKWFRNWHYFIGLLDTPMMERAMGFKSEVVMP